MNLVTNSMTTSNVLNIESYIKPPIDIYIWFPGTISISHIYIDAKVVIQQTQVIEIYSNNNNKFSENKNEIKMTMI